MTNPFTPEQISQILEEFFKVVGARQYIGARYVPIFGRKGEESIEWDNSAPYEPLTIVLYQGNSYTSRQYVPVGVEITNQEFWAITGNYNAQVEAYRKEVRDILPYDETPTEGSTKGVTSDGIKKAVDAAVSVETTRATAAEKVNADAIAAETTRATNAEKVNADAIANEVTRAKGAEKVNADAIAEETTNRESADATIRSQITEVASKGSVMVVIGDSWSSPEEGYVKWHDKVAKNLGMTVDNFAVGGSGFVNGTGNTFGDQLDRVHTKYANNPDAIGRIYVQGIVNDLFYESSQIVNAYNAFETKFASYFPDKGYKFVSASMFPTTTDEQIGKLYSLYSNMVFSHYASLVDVIGCVTAANLQSDGRHPGKPGYMQLGNAISDSSYLYAGSANQWFTNGFNKPTYSDKITITSEDFGASNKPVNWNIILHTNSDNTSRISGLVDWSNNPLLCYAIRKGYTNPIPIYKSNGSIAGYISAESYTSYAATFASPVQSSDRLRVDLSLIFK